MIEFKNIICAIDLADEHANAVGHYAASMARVFNSEIVVLYVAPEYNSVFNEMAQQANDINAALKQPRSVLGNKLESFMGQIFANARATGRLINGDVAQEILDTALQEDADLIIMGTRGAKSTKPMFYGSVAEKVARTSPLPVLIIPPA